MSKNKSISLVWFVVRTIHFITIDFVYSVDHKDFKYRRRLKEERLLDSAALPCYMIIGKDHGDKIKY